MSYRYRKSTTYIESALEDALDRITELEYELCDERERADAAESLFVESWWALKENDEEVAEKFRKENPEMGRFI